MHWHQSYGSSSQDRGAEQRVMRSVLGFGRGNVAVEKGDILERAGTIPVFVWFWKSRLMLACELPCFSLESRVLDRSNLIAA